MVRRSREPSVLSNRSRQSSRIRSFLDNTRVARTAYLHAVMSVVTEAILPVVSIVASLLNVLQLFLLGEFYLGWVGLALFLLPTFLALFYYLENMFHRENKLLELGLISGTFLITIY